MRRTLIESLFRGKLTEPAPQVIEAETVALLTELGEISRGRLGRSLAIRELDAGSCNGCELEITALGNAFYDLERFGLKFVASPRHADILMITGPMTRNMLEATRSTYEAIAAPKFVIAIGDCACTGGVFAGSPACIGATAHIINVDLRVPGCPPDPITLLKGLIGFARALARSPPHPSVQA